MDFSKSLILGIIDIVEKIIKQKKLKNDFQKNLKN